MGECIFCNIVEKKLPAEILFEDDEMLAFKDVQPQAPQHFLVIPKKHYPSLNEVPDPALFGRMMDVAVRIAREIGVSTSGYRIIANCNEEGGQTVFHVHLHVLGGRRMAWPPG